MVRSTETASQRAGRPPRLIGEVARSFGIHPQTLRLYEREGLLQPGRTSGNVRRYDDHDLERLGTILQLTRERGVNLAGVAMVLQLLDRIGELETRFEPPTAGGRRRASGPSAQRRMCSAGPI